MPNTDPLDDLEQYAVSAQEDDLEQYAVSDIKKKEPLEVGSEDGGQPLQTQGQDTQLPLGYQRILKTGKIPVNPFEKAALGQDSIDETQVSAFTGTPKESKPLQQKSVYDQALDDTEKWYGQWPSPRKKISNFNQAASQIKSKYQQHIDQGMPEEQVNANLNAEISQLAKQQGLLWENGGVSVPQAEVDKYEGTYKRKLDERLSKIAKDKKNPYIKDVLGNLGSGSAQVLATPYNLMAMSEKVGNAMLKPLGVDPSTYWQDFSKYLTENQSEMAENSKRYDEDIISLAKNGEVGKAIGAAVLQTAQTLPMLGTLIMGNAAGATNSALAFMGTSTAAQQYMSNNDKKDIGEFYKIIDAIGVGLAEVAGESLGTVSILNGIRRGIEERGANLVRVELTNMLRTNMERNISMIMRGNSDMVREGLSEGMTQFAQNLMTKATTDPNRDIWEGVTDATIVGALIGKGINLSLNAANSIQTAGIKKTIRETVKQVPENYSLEAKEKLIPLIIERDVIKSKVAEASDPIRKLYAPQIKVIDDEITKISAKEDGIELPVEEKPKEGEKKKPEASMPKSEVTVSNEGITSLKEEKPIEKPKGITLNEKTPISEDDKAILQLEGDNIFTRQINKDGEKFGQITVEQNADTWVVKDVVVDEEKKRYGKEVYRQMNELARADGKVLESEVPKKNQLKKATYMWESLVKSGEAKKYKEGGYYMLPPKAEQIVEPKIENIILESKKITKQIRIPDPELTNKELIERIKAENQGKKTNELYGLFVKARDLQPDIDAKKFNDIFNSVSPNMHIKEETLNFDATHYDNKKEMYVQNIQEEGYVRHIWEDGSTGSTPNKYMKELHNFTPIKELKNAGGQENANEIRIDQEQNDQGGSTPTESKGISGPDLQPSEAAGTATGNEKEGLTSKEEVPIEESPVTKKPDKNASIKEEKLLKEQKIKEAGGQVEIEKEGKTDLGYSSLSPGMKSLDDLAKERTQFNEGKDLIISERVKSILKDLGVPIAEKYLPKKYLGIFKHKSENIRVQSIIDVVVAVHETAHFISREKGIGENIRANKGMGKIRNLLTQIYVEFYPGAKATHSLEKRVEEGIAVLLEHYFAEPTYVADKYPDLVNEFIKPSGRFYDNKFGILLSNMNELVDDYAKLSAEQKIGSRIIRSDEIVKRDKGFTRAQKFIYEHFNRFEPFMRTGETAGVKGEFVDPYVHAYQWMNRGTFIHDWIKGNAKMVLKKDGNWETRLGTVRDYLHEIKGQEKEFDTFLVSRRVLEDYNNLVDAQNRLSALKEQYDNMVLEEADLAEEEGSSEELLQMQSEITEIEKDVEKLNNILKNDAFNIQDASTVVRKYEKPFKKAVDIYDGITKAMIDFSENTGLITGEIASKYRESKGYAPFFRFVNDELLPENAGTAPSSNGQTKAKIFKKRVGSKFDIISPTYNQMIAIGEVIGKGLENNIWANVAKISNQNEEIAKRFEAMPTQVFMDDKGNVNYPQDKDKNLIKVWVKGKRKYFKIAPEFAAVAKNLRGEEWGAFRKIIQLPSALFTRLTTSANPLFALGNITIDQLSAYMQSKTGYIPGVTVIDSFVEMVKTAGKITTDEETAFRKYIRIGGRRQTFAAFHELSPEKTIAKVEGATAFERFVEKMDLGLTVLELPSNMSEYMTRFAEYHRAVKQGKTETEAMYMASQVTTPFQLYGNWYGDIGRSWIKSLPYFNAAIQVNYKFFKTIKEQPEKVAIMSGALLSTALSMALLIMASGSDEQKRLLANMPARELARAIFFPNPWNKNKLIRIRVPEHIGALTGLAYLFVIQRGVKQKPRYNDYVDTATAFIPDQFNVLNPTNLIFSWIPQVLSPSIETAANIKTYPNLSPIVPDYLIENAPPELQYTEYTTRTAIAIGGLLNVSPGKLDYWVRNQFGVIGGAIIGRMPNNPLVRQEQHHVTTGRAYSYFYDDKVNSSQQYNTIDRKKAYSDAEKNELVSEYVLYNKVGNVLSNLRRTIQANNNIPESIKQQTFDLLVNINNGERGSDVNKEIESLNINILNFVKETGLDIEIQYNVTKETIEQSTEDYILKKINKQSNNISRIVPQ